VDALWLALAFLLGLVGRHMGLPALVGYLAAGFALNALGRQSSELLDQIAHAGVLLLLFSVGLKLRLKSLARPDVWGGGGLHLLVSGGRARPGAVGGARRCPWDRRCCWRSPWVFPARCWRPRRWRKRPNCGLFTAGWRSAS
jgi:hypothetical protein